MRNQRSFHLLSLFRKRGSLKNIFIIRNILRSVAFLAVLFFLINISGCFYYKEVTVNDPGENEISGKLKPGKIFIVHSGVNAHVWDQIYINNDSLKGKVIADNYVPLPERHAGKSSRPSHRFKSNQGEDRILNEVHLYLRSGAGSSPSKGSLALKDIEQCKIYKQDSGKQFLYWMFGLAGLFAGVIVVIILVIFALAAMGASCPYIYTNTENGYVFSGEIYSGAIYAPLERNDYLVLPGIISENGSYKLKMTNELEEIQNTNLTELLVIDHPAKSEVLVDKYGRCQVASRLSPPVEAFNFKGENILGLIRTKDSISYCGVIPDENMPLTDGVIMTFSLPEKVSNGKVFIRARNSAWLDNVYRNFNAMLGSYRDNWLKKQNRADGKTLTGWTLSQQIPLSVYVERNGQWEFCDYFNPAGPAALKDDVIPVSLEGLNPGKIRIKLETGTNFWEIDYAGLDISMETPADMKTVKIKSAITEKDNDVSEMLKYDDLKYYVQNEMNTFATLAFDVPQQTFKERTVVLHSKGYYNINYDSKGVPRFRQLNAARQPGEFLAYSRDLMRSAYRELMQKPGK